MSTTDNSVLQLMKGRDQYIKALSLEDGRLSFAVDTKKIYLDCDFTDPHGNSYEDRYAFGGSSGIYFGVRDFTVEETESNTFIFNFPAEFNGSTDEAPSTDDIIINSDGCFYRVLNIAIDPENERNTLITTSKLTVAGSGGGGGTTSGLTVAKDPNQNYNIIAANNSIPIGFKVVDSLPDTTIDVEVTINDNYAGTIRKVTQGEYTTVDLQRYSSHFLINESNKVLLRFVNEYNHAASVVYNDIRLIDLSVIVASNLGVTSRDSLQLPIRPYGASAMAERYINIRMNIPGYLNPVTDRVPFSSNVDGGQEYIYTLDLSAHIEGNYTVDVWITARPDINENEWLTSPEVTTSFIYRSADSTIPMLSASLGKSTYEQYQTAQVEYLAAYEGSTANVHLTAYCGEELMVDQTAAVTYNESHTWNVILSKAGTWRFIVAIDDYNLAETIENITVTALQAELPEIETSSLQLSLSAAGRSNDESDPATWTYRNIECDFENFNWNTNGWITDDNLVTSLHLTNGAKLTIPFAMFSGENTDGRGAQGTGKTIEINYKVSNVRDVNQILINGASWYRGKVYTGIVGTGDKICMNTQDQINYHTPEEDAALTEDERAATNGLRAYITEDQRVHITFSIQSNSANNTNANLIYTYVNGVLSGLVKYSGNIQDSSSESPSYLVFDSTYGDIDLYSVRVYSVYSSDRIVLNNYAADLPTVAERLAIAENNDALNSNDEISLTKVQSLGNIPYIVFTGGLATGDKKGNILDSDGNPIKVLNDKGEYVNQTGGTGTIRALPTGKKDFRYMPCYFVDPEHPDRNFGTANAPVEAVVYAQGTSSLAYPVKNLRVRFMNKKDKYSLLPAIPIEGLDSMDAATQEKALAEQEKWTKLPKVALFTLKADYMDSSLAHNTGTGNALAAIYDSVNIKSVAQEQYPDKTICNNVVGRPIIAFWRTGDSIGTETYIGRYNFDTDKAEHSLFGFEPDEDGTYGRLVDENNNYITGFQGTVDESKNWDGDNLASKTYYTAPRDDAVWTGNSAAAFKTYVTKTGPLYEKVEGPGTIQCWEFLNNAADLCGFRIDWHEGVDSMDIWTAAFESRYPEYEDQVGSDKRAFQRLVNWLHTTDQNYADPDRDITPITYGGTTYTKDTREYRLAKFKDEFDTYMRKDFTLFYYIMTEALLMLDSRGKNMMMCSFDIDNVNNTGHWYPIFYDMDTILGVDNSGVLRYSYDVDDEIDTLAYNARANYGHYEDGNWVANGMYSTLWANVREAFYDDIATLYNRMRNGGKFTVDFLTKSYNEMQADAFAEIYDNKDGWYKYIRPLTEETTVTVNGVTTTKVGVNWIHAEQGTRSLHRRHFLEHRFAFLDSKYAIPTGKGGVADVDLRMNGCSAYLDAENTQPNPSGAKYHPDPHTLQFTFKSQSTQYGATQIGGNNPVQIIKLAPNTPVQTVAPAGMLPSSLGDTEAYIFHLGEIYDIGDLSDKFLLQITFNSKNKIRVLRLGCDDPSYKTDKATTIGGLSNCPLLEDVYLQRALFANTTLDLTAQVYLKNVYATGSNLRVIRFAAGADLKHLELPASMTVLNLKDVLFFDTKTNPSNLTFESVANLNGISIENCPKVDTYALMNTIMAQDEDESGQILNIRLPDINWTVNEINEDTCVLADDVINDIKILDYIANIPSGYTTTAADGTNNTISRALTNNTYFGGTITINNGDYWINDLDIKNKYGQLFPNLKIVYKNPEKIIAGYDIVIHAPNTGDPVYSTATHKNSITIGSNEAIGFNLKEHLETQVATPAIAPGVEWTYEFKGWSYTQVEATPSESILAGYLAEGIEMTYNSADNTYTADENCPESLTEDDYTDQQIDLYPIFLMHKRIYQVTFMYTPQGVTPAEQWDVIDYEYGSQISLPTNLPAVIDYDPNHDGDVSKTTIQLLDTFKFGSSDYTDFVVQSNVTLYPVYSQPVYMDTLTNPPTAYFKTRTPTEDNNKNAISLFSATTFEADGVTYDINDGVVAVIDESVAIGAICVPKMIDGKYVVSVKNESPSLRRLYFEEGCPIKYIADGGNGVIKAGFNGSDSAPNTTLEYVDLAALHQLETIGGCDATHNTGTNNDMIFAYCPNLHISGLPDTLKIISTGTFRGDTSLSFGQIPNDILNIGDYAFTGCTGLGEVIFAPTFDATEIITMHNDPSKIGIDSYWPRIGGHAFEGCSNLTFCRYYSSDSGLIYGETNLAGVRAIGDYAFSGCSELILTLTAMRDDVNYTNRTILYIGARAFMDCRKLGLQQLPINIEYIGLRAFRNCGDLHYLTGIPSTLRTIGSEAFHNDTLAGNNSYNLIWAFPAEVNSDPVNGTTTSVVNVVDGLALSGAKINTLTFQFEKGQFADEQQAQNFVAAVPGNEPWKTAFTEYTGEGDERVYLPTYAFGATRVSGEGSVRVQTSLID